MTTTGETEDTIATTMNGASHPAEPLGVVAVTRTLCDYALAQERVAVMSERPDGTRLIAIGHVLCVTDKVAIVARSRRSTRSEGTRSAKRDGEVFVRLDAIVKIVPAPRRHDR